MQSLDKVVLVSLEPWDQVWRRNQHLAANLVRHALVRQLVFVCPGIKLNHRASYEAEPGITVITPHLVLPRKRGGLGLLSKEVRLRTMRGTTVLWINDPVIGVGCLRADVPAVYDVTDDWRSASLGESDRSALLVAEDRLAREATTVVCSNVLRDRWRERYGLDATLINNGVDVQVYANAEPVALAGPPPHAVYVGTLHRERLDIELANRIARAETIGTLHLIGPDSLDEASRSALLAGGKTILHGPVDHTKVPAFMAAADVLVCPHRVDTFTLSLDAIKRFEYLASGRPVVATPSGGFEEFADCPGFHVVAAERFVDVLGEVATRTFAVSRRQAWKHDWSERARQFADVLGAAQPS